MTRGGIDDIDEVVFPLSRYSSGNDGNTAFPFLGHPVGNSRAVIDIADAIGLAGIKQNPLGSGSLPASIWAMIPIFR